MIHSAIILGLLAVAVRGAPGPVRWLPMAVDTTVVAPNPTNTATSPLSNGCASSSSSFIRDDREMLIARGARSTKPDRQAAVPAALTTMGRPSKVTATPARTASSNKLSPTGTSITTWTTTVTIASRKSSSTPSQSQDNGSAIRARKDVPHFKNSKIQKAKINSTQIPADATTQLSYALTDIVTDLGVFLNSSATIETQGTRKRDRQVLEDVEQTLPMKQNRSIEALPSRGGFKEYSSNNFALEIMTADSHRRFTYSSIQFLDHLGIDDIDARREYPKDRIGVSNPVSFL